MIPRLIDAHSFVWVIQEERFIKWNPDATQNAKIEETTEGYMQGVVSGTGGRKKTISSVFVRSLEVVRETKKRANGVCQYCQQAAPFIDKNGNPYLEVHHVIWLSRGDKRWSRRKRLWLRKQQFIAVNDSTVVEIPRLFYYCTLFNL